MLQGIYTAAGLFNLRCHELAGLFTLGQAQHIRQKVCQAFHRIIQIAGGKGKSIGIDIIGVRSPGLILEHRNLHAHHIPCLGFQINLLLGSHQGHIQGFVCHAGAGQHKILVGRRNACLYLFTKSFVLTHQVQELTHQFIPLILKELVSPDCRRQLFLETGKLHTGGIHMFCTHVMSTSFLTAGYFAS